MKRFSQENFSKNSSFQAKKNRRYRNNSDKVCERLYNDWYGPEMAMAEIESRQSPSQNMAHLVNEVLISLDRDDFTLLRKIVDKWKDIVGPDIRYHASPRRIKDKILFIEVHNTSWRFHLEMNFKSEILKLIQEVSNDHIIELRFVTGGKTKRR